MMMSSKRAGSAHRNGFARRVDYIVLAASALTSSEAIGYLPQASTQIRTY